MVSGLFLRFRELCYVIVELENNGDAVSYYNRETATVVRHRWIHNKEIPLSSGHLSQQKYSLKSWSGTPNRKKLFNLFLNHGKY